MHTSRVTLLDDVLINGTGSEESGALPLQHITGIAGLGLVITSVLGDADISLGYVTSPDGENYESYDDTPLIITSSLTERPGQPEGGNMWNQPSLTPSAQYIKYKVIGVNLNPADTRVTLYAFITESPR